MAWLQVSTESKTLKMPVDYQVLIPQYTGAHDKGCVDFDGPYPVLYLLHGKRGDGTEFLRHTSLERYIWGLPLAVALPNGHNSWFRNMENGLKYADFVCHEMPMKTEEWFNVSSERYIGGYSMGGYGVLHAALTCPERFTHVISFAAAIRGYESTLKKSTELAQLIFGNDDPAASACLFSLAKKAVSANKPQFYISCGKNDHRLPDNEQFAEHLQKLGFSVVFCAEDGGHDWDYVDTALRKAINWLNLKGDV